MNQETKKKLFQLIENCYRTSNEIKEGIATNQQVHDSFNSSIKEVYELLKPIDSFEYRKFDAWKQKGYLWQGRVIPGYANSDKQILDLIGILEEIAGYQKTDSEVHLIANDEFKARRYFRKLFESAKNEIFIIDNYLSSNIFDFLEDIEESIEIRFLAGKSQVKPGFKNDFLSWKRPKIECRLHDSTNHDRYILLDNKELYHLGASINGIGKNDFTIKRLEGGEKIQHLKNLWEESIILN